MRMKGILERGYSKFWQNKIEFLSLVQDFFKSGLKLKIKATPETEVSS